MKVDISQVQALRVAIRELLSAQPIVLNQSSYKDFNNCKRLFAWRRLQNLSPVSRRSALEIGTAIHAGLAVFHAGGFKLEEELAALATREPVLGTKAFPQDGPEFEQACEDYAAAQEELREVSKLSAIEQAMFVAMRKLRERSGPTTSFEDKTLSEAEDIVKRVLPAYVEHYQGTGEIWKPLNQEIEVLVEVGTGTNIWLRMKSDNLSTARGGLYIVDYKTAGKLDPRDLLKYELDTQLSAYIYGLSKFLTEQIRKEDPNADEVFIRGAIIDVLVKTQVPQFARELFTRTPAELAEYEAEWIEVSNELRERLIRVQNGEDWKIVFYRNTDNCFRYGTCPFRDVCLKDTPVRRALYDKREPDYVDEAQKRLNQEANS